MPVRKILRMGNPLLLEKARPVQAFNTPFLDDLIRDLKDTMHDANGVGLAAPQIGELLQVVIFGVHNNPRYPHAEPVPEQVLINPEITPLSQETEAGWEGCLSVPGMRGWVPRYQSIRYSGYDENGDFRSVEASGFHARVVQHECDHLWGVLYPMRVTDFTRFGFTEEINQRSVV